MGKANEAIPEWGTVMTRHRLLFTVFWTTVFLMVCAYFAINFGGHMVG